MVTRINKISAMLATVAIFFFAALSTAQAGIIDPWLNPATNTNTQGWEDELIWVVEYAPKDGAGELLNPYGMNVGDWVYGSLKYKLTYQTSPIATRVLTGKQFDLTLNFNGNSVWFNHADKDLSMDTVTLTDGFLSEMDMVIPTALDYWVTEFDLLLVQGGSTQVLRCGDVYINELPAGAAPAVPLPSAIWLFGSGLIGMVGVRRKMKK